MEDTSSALLCPSRSGTPGRPIYSICTLASQPQGTSLHTTNRPAHLAQRHWTLLPLLPPGNKVQCCWAEGDSPSFCGPVSAQLGGQLQEPLQELLPSHWGPSLVLHALLQLEVPTQLTASTRQASHCGTHYCHEPVHSSTRQLVVTAQCLHVLQLRDLPPPQALTPCNRTNL